MSVQPASSELVCLNLIRPQLIDTPLKLRLIRFLSAYRQHAESARGLCGWLGETDTRVVEQALADLCAAGLVTRSGDEGAPRYRLAGGPDHDDALICLAESTQEPYQLRLLEAYVRIVARQPDAQPSESASRPRAVSAVA
jgi:Fe2+ or Zn2+ uptake regulation protein